MPIIESIKIARGRGATDEQILQEIIRQNPEKAQTFKEALEKGMNSTQIIEEIIRERTPKALPRSGETSLQGLPPEKKEKPIAKTEEELKFEEAKKRIEALKREAQARAKRKQQEQAKAEFLEKKAEKKERTEIKEEERRKKLLESFLEEEKERIKPSIPPKIPPPPPSPPKKPEVLRPIPAKPSFGAKLWIRFLIASLVLVILAGFSTFWYWYLVIRVRPPISPSPSPGPGPGPSPSPSPGPGPEIIIPPSLFSIEETREISIASSQESPTLIQQALQEWLDANQFRRIVIKNTTENRVLGLKDFFEALLIRAPSELYQKLENEFTLFVYSQGKEIGNRIGFVTKVKNEEGLEALLQSQESTMEEDFKTFLDLMGERGPAIVSYFRDAINVRGYAGPNFRYQTLGREDLNICYLISQDYFVFTSSWESMQKTINRLGIFGKPVELTQELKWGDTGDEVKLLQLWLKQDPVIYPEGKITGYFGELTEKAVIRFQEKYQAEILAPQGFTKGTGVVDLYTRVKLNEIYGKSGLILPTTELITDLRYGDHGVEVKLLQTWLAKDREVYAEGITSGWFGYLTQQAVIRFQEKYASEILTPQGLKRGTGIVDALTRKKLTELYGK